MEKMTFGKQKYFFVTSLIFILFLAWLSGHTRQDEDILNKVQKVMPEAKYFTQVTANPLTFIVFTDSTQKDIIGYIAIGESRGYAGPLTAGVGVSLQGKIISTAIMSHHDTPSYIRQIEKKQFLDNFKGLPANDPLIIGKQGFDCVTGATYSSKGIARAIAQASHGIAKNQLGLSSSEEQLSFLFGLKEISIIALFSLVVAGISFKVKKFRMVTLVGSLLIIGFIYNMPPTIGSIAGTFMGFFPPFKEFIFWYLLFLGIPLVNFLFAKNIYCYWMCPFGAAQEFTGKLCSVKLKCSSETKQRLKKVKYCFFYLALLLAFLVNTPSIATFEPFTVLFGQDGYGVQWILLPLILLATFFIDRFWCNYFCPIGVANDFVARLGWKFRSLLLRTTWTSNSASPSIMEKEKKVGQVDKTKYSENDKYLISLVIGTAILILAEVYQNLTLCGKFF